MTDDTSANDGRDGTTLLSRRNVLISLGATGAGTLAVLDNFTDVLEAGNSSIREDPPLTNPNDDDTDNTAFQTPWDPDELVITVEQNEADSPVQGFLEDYGYEELGNAVAFWNDYIESNSAFDLTLSFKHNHDNPDILLKQASHMGECGPEYKGPGFGSDTWSAHACVETLQETPTDNDLPVTGTIGQGRGSTNLYHLIAKHAIGRLLGYDIWSDPVDVMNPKILITPADNLAGEVSHLYHRLEGSDERETLDLSEAVIKTRNPVRGTDIMLEEVVRTLNQHLTEHHNALEEWHSTIDELGLDVYAEAHEETIVNDELAYVNETIALINDVLDTYTREELADGPDELETVADRLETINAWPGDSEPYDLQIHRYVTDALWSAWAAEQTPTANQSA